jgi:hypothetical protein
MFLVISPSHSLRTPIEPQGIFRTRCSSSNHLPIHLEHLPIQSEHLSSSPEHPLSSINTSRTRYPTSVHPDICSEHLIDEPEHAQSPWTFSERDEHHPSTFPFTQNTSHPRQNTHGAVKTSTEHPNNCSEHLRDRPEHMYNLNVSSQ